MKDEHLIPDLIKQIVTAMNTGRPTEKFYAEARLRAIIEYINKSLPKAK